MPTISERRLLGFDSVYAQREKALSQISDNRVGWFRIFESYAGAWQQNVEVDHDTVLTNHAVFACMTLIASDIAKLRVKLVQQDTDGIWTEVTNPAYSPFLRKPNRWQTRIQFWEYWMLSKLSRGNTYALKERDNRGVVVRAYILDPQYVIPLVSDDGDVFYELTTDHLSGIHERIIVPAREMIHDRMNCLHHPLVGISPIFASGLAATQGLKIQDNATKFFENRSTPGGVVSVPGEIADDTALRLKTQWETNYGGANSGKVAILGDGMEFKPITMSAEDSQLIDQFKWTADIVCSTFHVPPYKIGIGPMPTYNNIQALNVEYYSQCLQSLIEAAEECLDDALGIGWGTGLGTEFDLDGLLRMDSVTQLDVLQKSKGLLTLDELRKRLEYKPITGGNTVYLQQQDHSIEAIAARDKMLIDEANAPAGSEDDADDDDAEPDVEEQVRNVRNEIRAIRAREFVAG